MVDGDPQCNLTGLSINNDFSKVFNNSEIGNIYDSLCTVFNSALKLIEPTNCLNVDGFDNLFLLAGSIRLSERELQLSSAHNFKFTALNNLVGSFSYLIDKTCEKYEIDYVIIDMNPALSAINQNLLMLSDYFIIPMIDDDFAPMSLESLGWIFPQRNEWLITAIEKTSDSYYKFPNKKPTKLLSVVVRDFIANQHLIDQLNERFVPSLNSIEMKADNYQGFTIPNFDSYKSGYVDVLLKISNLVIKTK